VSYQPEERYWTDYLRIALPVVGLLLMLGLFWYWASAVIGDDDDNQPTARPTNAVAVLTEPVPTATNKPEVVLNPETVTPEPTQKPTQGASSSDEETPTEEATKASAEEPTDEAPGKGFKTGDILVTNDSTNLRVCWTKQQNPAATSGSTSRCQTTARKATSLTNSWINLKNRTHTENVVPPTCWSVHGLRILIVSHALQWYPPLWPGIRRALFGTRQDRARCAGQFAGSARDE
jgi:hypothetical protein